jgi:two-component system alkaline phosphatase synthesis response regulator PhoP
MDKKILIVDDAPYIRLLLEACFEELVESGVKLLFAEDGKSALDIIVQEKPDLIFLDIMLPKMNGYEVCNAVKNELGIKEPYIVILSAKGQEFDRSMGNEVGADQYLTKPFTPQQIIETATRILELA